MAERLPKKRRTKPKTQPSSKPEKQHPLWDSREDFQAAINGDLLSSDAIMKLQRTVGNQATMELLANQQANAPFVQRMPTLSEFKSQTKVGKTIRWKIKALDKLVSSYHRVPVANHQARLNKLNHIMGACHRYLSYSDAKAKRKPGVRALQLQAQREQQIFQALHTSDNASNLKSQFRYAVQALDAAAEAEAADNDNILPIYDHAGQVVHNVKLQIEINQPALFDELIQDDVNTLMGLLNDPNLPTITQNVLLEVLGNINDVKLQQGNPGARQAKTGENTGGKSYVVNHALDTDRKMGTSERVASLAHELTHVSSGESFGNTPAFLLFDPNMSDSDVADLVTHRLGRVAELETRYQNSPAFSAKQKDLIQSKLDYAKESKLKKYAESYRTAGQARLDGNPPLGSNKYNEGQYYMRLHNQVNRIAQLVPDGNSTLIEYDTVMNQILVYMHMWNIPQSNSFYAHLRLVAQEAYDDREAGRTGA